MKTLLENYRNEINEKMIRFLWQQWSSLGVVGYGNGENPWIIDPEALLLFSLTISRSEPRLFDEIMDWLDINGRFCNIQRLRSILKKEDFSCHKIMKAVAKIMTERGKTTKWDRLSQKSNQQDSSENLFFKKNGEQIPHFGKPDPIFQEYGLLRGPLKFRGHTQPVKASKNTGLIFKLRTLWGVNTRAEIILYLLTHESGHPRQIARETYFFQKTIQDVLVDMSRSGLVYIQQKGKEKHYWIKQDDWYNLLQITDKKLVWINWPSLFSALEKVWLKLNEPDFLNLDSLLQSSELRQIMKAIRPKIESAGFTRVLSDDKLYLGEEYKPIFVQDIKKLYDQLLTFTK